MFGIVPLDPGEEVLGGPAVGLGSSSLRGHLRSKPGQPEFSETERKLFSSSESRFENRLDNETILNRLLLLSLD